MVTEKLMMSEGPIIEWPAGQNKPFPCPHGLPCMRSLHDTNLQLKPRAFPKYSTQSESDTQVVVLKDVVLDHRHKRTNRHDRSNRLECTNGNDT